MSRFTRGLAPLRHRGFRLLAGGQLASNVGDAAYAVALPWYVLATHGGALLLGTVLAAYGVPRTVTLLAGGQASDRWRPWTVMMGSDLVRVLATGGLAVAAAAGPARAVILVPIAIVLGAGEGMFLPGSFAIIPALLPDADLQAGNALSSAGTQLATLAGPALGGAMVALLGPAPAFGLDAASFAVSALTLAGIRAAQRPAAHTNTAATTPLSPATADATGPADGTAPGAPAPTPAGAPGAHPAGPEPGTPATVRAVLRSERALQVALVITIVANLGSGGMDGVALPSLAHGPLHTGAGGFGALVAAFGAGALLGTLVAAHVRRARRPAIAGSVAFLAEAVFMTLVPYLGGPIGAAAMLVGFGAMNGFGNVTTITAFQRWAPADMLGRLSAVLMVASVGVYPISVLLGGAVVHTWGPAVFFPLAAAALAVAILGGLTQRSWRDFGVVTPVASEAGLTDPATGDPATGDSATDNPGPGTTPAIGTVRYTS
ncbi:MAG TPA: MFS transporter [Streptosporangiaceae bacterium]|jgi:predicted MFS family arabinose efflux permease